ncbi:MAG: serine hydrolase domain-containing protein [Acidimicrobiia bacterium]
MLRNRLVLLVALAALVAGVLGLTVPAGAASGNNADTALDKALAKFVARPDGSPGIAVVVQRGASPVLHEAGTAVVGSEHPIALDDHTRVASVAKAYSGATSLAEVSAGALAVDSTVGKVLTGMPAEWADVTLTQLLQHTSGIPDFSRSKEFADAFRGNLLVPPAPETLVTYVFDEPMLFTPGARYHYSNTDNILVGLMVQAATGQPYENELQAKVATPLGLTETTLPAGNFMPQPYVHGYDISDPKQPEDMSELFAAGWTWASGGVVATPRDANAFIRGYVGGELFDATTRKAQMTFRPGKSEPTGPGTNSAGLGVFRYKTRCGTFYGHTGNTPGYTQFVAASNDGTRSASVSVNAQITPNVNKSAFPALRTIFELAVCAAAA